VCGSLRWLRHGHCSTGVHVRDVREACVEALVAAGHSLTHSKHSLTCTAYTLVTKTGITQRAMMKHPACSQCGQRLEQGRPANTAHPGTPTTPPCCAATASAPADVLNCAPAAEDMQVRADGGHGVARAVVLAHQQAMHLPQRARIGLWLRCCPRARPVTPPPPAPMPPSPANALVQKPQLSPQQTPSTLSEP